jgi:uncharacterized membrane protein
MMIYIASYLAALGLFVLVDMVWLSIMAVPLYRTTLGDILLPGVNVAPAIAFYLIYPVGLVIFAVLPALNRSSFISALVHGALFGFFTYATYDLTNQVTLRNWTLRLTLIDVAWGSVVATLAAAGGYWTASKMGGMS